MVGLTTSSYALDSLLVVMIGVVLAAPVLARIARRKFDIFEPIVLFAVVYGVMFVARPAAMLLEDSLVYEGPRSTLDVSRTFTEMLVMALFGALAFVVGYWLSLGGRLARAHRPPREDFRVGRVTVAALLFGLVGVCSLGLFAASSGGVRLVDAILHSGRNTELLEPSGSSMYVRFLFLVIIPAALVVLVLGLDRRSVPLVVAALALAALLVAEASPIGSRITLLPLLGGVYVLYYVRRSARPSLLAVLVVAAVAVLGSTFLSDLRGRAARGESVGETIARATSPSRLLDSVATGPDTEMAPALSAALGVIPERLSHTHGATVFGDLVLRPIPRALWQGKPQIPRHKLLATIWPIEYARGTINAEFSALLYWYWDFGVLGVIVALVAYGILARYLYEYFGLHREHPYVQVLYSLSLWFVVIGLRDSPVDTFVRACFVLLPVWLIFVFARIPLRARSEQSLSTGRSAAS
jgi:hypothetical protein